MRDRTGLDFDTLAARHPHLLAVSLSPYGRSGPWSDRPGCDLTAQAASSLPLGLGSADHSPLRIPFDQGDYQAAFHGAAAVLCALRERRRSGLGQGIDISTAEVMAYLVGGMHNVSVKNGNRWVRRGTLLGGAPYPTGFFNCADGFVCIASTTPAQWEAFLGLMDNPKWAKDEARNSIYLGLVDAQPAHRHFQEWLMGYTRAELLEMAAAESIVMGVAQTVDEVLASPQFAYRGLWAEVEVGGAARKIPKAGYLFGESPTAVTAAGPRARLVVALPTWRASRWCCPWRTPAARPRRHPRARLRLELGRPDGRSAAGRHGRGGDPRGDLEAAGPDAVLELHLALLLPQQPLEDVDDDQHRHPRGRRDWSANWPSRSTS